MQEPILRIHHLGITFSQYTKGLRRTPLNVINQLDIELVEGEILAVVGSSGSGKSLLASAILGILPGNAKLTGDMYYRGQRLNQKEKERIRGREIVLIPQSVNYLDPLQKVGKQIAISIKNKNGRHETIKELVQRYGLQEDVVNYYPFQLSGGMARKVLLATALVSDSKVLIADEPTPGLDEASLKEVLKDFRGLADEGRAVLMITHDMEAALKIADKIAVFYAGTTLEVANTEDFNDSGDLLRHPYTRALNRARPTVRFAPIEGSQPYPNQLPEGCPFSDRCEIKTGECRKQMPELREVRGGKVRCIHAT